MENRLPRMLRQRERKRADRAFVIINGRRRKLGVWGSAEAEQRYRELISEITAPAPRPSTTARERPACPTIAEIMAPFLQEMLSRFRSNKSEQAHYRGAMRVLKEEFADLPAGEFGPRRLRRVQQAMVCKGWSRKYINGQVGRVRRLFKWAVADERLGAAVYQALQTVEPLTLGRTDAPEPVPVTAVDDATVDATLAHMSATVRDMVEVQRLCGCRPAELCQMASEHIDRSGAVWLYSPPKHKTQHYGKRRVVALGPRAQSILTKYLFRDGGFFKYDSAGYRQCVRRACDRAFPAPDGVEGAELKAWRRSHRWKPNQLRHAAATKVRAEFGLEGAQHILGHSRADVTQIYAERNMAQAVAIAERIG